MATVQYDPCMTFPPKPGREGMNSIKATTASPRLTSKVRRSFKSNGQEPRNTQVRRSR